MIRSVRTLHEIRRKRSNRSFHNFTMLHLNHKSLLYPELVKISILAGGCWGNFGGLWNVVVEI